MIEILEQSTGNVVAMRLNGKLLHRDYQELVPLVEKRIEEHGGVRCFIEMNEFHGIELRSPLGRNQVRRSPCRADRALRRRGRSSLAILDDQTGQGDLFQSRDAVLRYRRTRQSLGMDHFGALNRITVRRQHKKRAGTARLSPSRDKPRRLTRRFALPARPWPFA